MTHSLTTILGFLMGMIFGGITGILLGAFAIQASYKKALGPLHDPLMDQMKKPKRFRDEARYSAGKIKPDGPPSGGSEEGYH